MRCYSIETARNTRVVSMLWQSPPVCISHIGFAPRRKGFSMKSIAQIMEFLGNLLKLVRWGSLGDLQKHIEGEEPKRVASEFEKWIANGCLLQYVGNHVIDCDTAPFVPLGWLVEEHQKGGQLSWDASKVKLLVKLNEGESYVGGHELRKRLKDEPVLNANVLDYLLARPELVPEEWKSRLVFFWGTIYRDSDDYLFVRYLFWNGERWHWDYYCLNDGWRAFNPAAVRAHS